MRLKYILLSILLLGGMDLFAQESSGLYAIYDFSIRNAATECFIALRNGDSKVYDMLLSEQAVDEGSDFPESVRAMAKSARTEVSAAVASLSPIRPYVSYDYRYISLKDVSYVLGIAVAEYQTPEVGGNYNMVARPLYFVYTDRGWKAFWLGQSWLKARFADKDKLVILDTDDREVPLSEKVGKLRDDFYNKLVGTTSKPEPKPRQTPTQTQNNRTNVPAEPAKEPASDVSETVYSYTDGPIPYEAATVKPTFGGQPASTFVDWVKRNVKYPQTAKKQGLSGKVKIKFIIDKAGNVKNVTLVDSAGKRSKKDFEEQVSWAEFLCEQYQSELARLNKDTSTSIESLTKTQKLYDQAKNRLNRLKRLAANRTYVLPEYSELDDEALRVVSTSPPWEPGKYQDNPIAVEYTVTVDMKP